MPRMIFKGLEAKQIQAIGKELIDELSSALACPREYFTMEVVNSTFVTDEKINSTIVAVEVFWFDRGIEKQDLTAQIIYKYLKRVTASTVTAIFHILEPNNYYENGEHIE